MTIRVVIADDQQLIRTGFRMILDDEADIEVIGEATTGTEAIAVTRELRPDVVLMDIRMPELDGIEATRRILAHNHEPKTSVLILTTFDLDEYVYDALRGGAWLPLRVPCRLPALQALGRGAVSRRAARRAVRGAAVHPAVDHRADRLHRPAARSHIRRRNRRAVFAVGDGDALLAPSITRRLIEEFVAPRTPDNTTPGLDELTPRELEVFRLLATGMTNSEIASKLIVGETTVKTHVTRILTKLRVRDRVQAVVLAYETGLVSPGHTTTI